MNVQVSSTLVVYQLIALHTKSVYFEYSFTLKIPHSFSPSAFCKTREAPLQGNLIDFCPW